MPRKVIDIGTDRTKSSGAPAADAASTRASERVHAAGLRRGRLLNALLLAALIIATLLNVGMGEASVSRVVTPSVVLRVVGRRTPLLSAYVAPVPAYLDSIVWQLRLPRALSALVIGMLLAMAGVAFQGLLMNPLADPYTVGVSSGAALGAMIVAVAGGAAWLGGFAQPLAAFATGLLAVTLVYFLSRVQGRSSVSAFLLAGAVVGTFLWSLVPLLLSIANRTGNLDRNSALLAQLLGSLQNVGWTKLALLMPFALLGFALLWPQTEALNLMTLGEESALHLGVDTEACKRRVLIAGSLVTAAAVAVAGIIAFVGLVVPHLARRLVGPDHRRLLPTAMLLGGFLLTVADWMSRVFLANLEIGVITSLIGAPFFCYLLRRRLVASEVS